MKEETKSEPKGNVIYLSTGYKVDYNGTPKEFDHLVNAIIGETFMQAMEANFGGDQATKLMINECERVHLIYDVSYTELIKSTVYNLVTTVNKVADTQQKAEKEKKVN